MTVQDMLSQGAKDFITRHGGKANVSGFLAIASETMTGAAAADTTALAAGNEFAIDTAAANTAADMLNSAGEVQLGVGDDSGNGEIVLTLTMANGADQTAATETFVETITVTVTDNHALGTGNYTQDRPVAQSRVEQQPRS